LACLNFNRSIPPFFKTKARISVPTKKLSSPSMPGAAATAVAGTKEAHVSMRDDGREREEQEAPQRPQERLDERAACVKRLKLVASTLPCPEDGEEESAGDCSLQLLKSLQRLNSCYNLDGIFEFRKELVGLIFIFGEKQFKLRPKTIHRSVNYLDRLLHKLPDVSHLFYNPFVAGCILVAGTIVSLCL
jgi:hypothetical protein